MTVEGGRNLKRDEFRHDPIGHIEIKNKMTVGELMSEYSNAGFAAGMLSKAVDIYAEMIGQEEVINFLSIAGAMVPAGMRKIIVGLIEDGYVDVLVTTGATLTHDTIEAIDGRHHHGRVIRDENGSTRMQDELLRDEEVDRIYDVYLPQETFSSLERHLRTNVFPKLDRQVSIRELTTELGRANLENDGKKSGSKEKGIAAMAYECGVPIYCPGIQDSMIGLQAWMYSQISSFSLNAISDMTEINDIAHNAEKRGAMIVGGGVPKNYILQAMLLTPRAYDYAVQLTGDSENLGGLSGASLDEARSWGKLEKDSKNVTVYADATITFPLLVAAAREKIGAI